MGALQSPYSMRNIHYYLIHYEIINCSSKLVYSQIVCIVRHLCHLYHDRLLAAIDPPHCELHAVRNGESFVVVVVVVVVVELLVVPASESELIDDPGSTGGEGRGMKGAPGPRGSLFAVILSVALCPMVSISGMSCISAAGVTTPYRHSVMGKVTTASPSGHWAAYTLCINEGLQCLIIKSGEMLCAATIHLYRVSVRDVKNTF